MKLRTWLILDDVLLPPSLPALSMIHYIELHMRNTLKGKPHLTLYPSEQQNCTTKRQGKLQALTGNQPGVHAIQNRNLSFFFIVAILNYKWIFFSGVKGNNRSIKH